MVTSWHPASKLAAARPIAEARASWLVLLNFMRFLRCEPIPLQPPKTCLGFLADHCKSRLRSAATGSPTAPVPFSFLDSPARAVVRYGRNRGGIGMRVIRRILCVEQ